MTTVTELVNAVPPAIRRHKNRIYGFVPAIVIAVWDPKNEKRHQQGYVQVYFPGMQLEADHVKSAKSDPEKGVSPLRDADPLIAPWARVASPELGVYQIPQLGDEVLVAFEHGDLSRPYVLGQLWNGKAPIPDPTTPGDSQTMPGHNGGTPVETPDLKPDSIAGGSGKNKIMFFKSRKGNLVVLDDKNGTVRICDAKGNSRISLENETIKIIQSTGDIKFNAAKTIRIDCENYECHATSSIRYEAGNDIHIIAMSAISHASGGSTTMTAGQSFLKTSDKQVWVQADSSCTFTAGANTTIVSLDDKTKIEAKSMISITGAMGIECNTEGVNSAGGAMVAISSPMKINFQSSNDMKLAGSTVMFN